MHRSRNIIWKNIEYPLTLIVFSAAVLFAAKAHCQDSGAQPVPSPATTANVEVPIEDLELLLRPLTKEELVVEANGWQNCLKQKVQDIAKIRIRLKSDKRLAEEKAKTAAEAARSTQGEPSAASSQALQAADQAASAVRQTQQSLADQLPELIEEKAQIVKRMEAVLSALELKGGDVTAYRQYVSALTGIALDASDAGSFYAVAKAWVFSEEGGQRWLWNIAKFLLILVLFYFGASLVAGLVTRGASRVRGTSKLLVDFLGKFVRQVVMIIGLVIALAALEVNITPLLAAMGAAGFVIGFALQGTLSNFASGLLILAYRPFDVGDSIDAAGVSGSVDSVSLFSTLIRSFDNKLMIVPNNDIWGGTITNSTASETRRVDMVFRISHDDDIAAAKATLRSLVSKHHLVLKEPLPVVQVSELGESSINLICRPWTKTSDYWTLYWDLNEAVKAEFDRQNISIPYPQTEVHIRREGERP